MKALKSMQGTNRLLQLFKMNPSSILHLGLVYRTISLLLTAFIFFVGTPSPIIFKIGVVFGLVVAGWIVADLQRRYIKKTKIVKMLVITETIGLTCLLFPTGGIVSPFIWYALNPVLIAAGFLTPLFSWTILTVYLSSATLIASRFDTIEQIVREKSYVYLVSFLTILLAILFSKLTKELLAKTVLLEKQQQELLVVNEKLTETNYKSRVTMEHIMSFYHLMDGMSSAKTPQMIMQDITKSVLTCTQVDAAFFWLTDVNHQNSQLVNTTANSALEADLKTVWSSIRLKPGTFISKVGDELYFMKVVRTSVNIGMIGVEVSADVPITQTFLFRRPFEYLANLSEILLEQIYMDEMKNQLIIIEEQNRIANEIHDSVAQRMFGIVYALHGLQVRSETITKEELNEEYAFLSKSAQTTIKELRSAIYRLSSVKKGEYPFFNRVKTYLDEYAQLNGIHIEYELTGSESLLASDLKEALYRIICEACGNAVRHGKASLIELKLVIMEKNLEVIISDDGSGLSPQDGRKQREQGIGLVNMNNTVNSFGGEFSIEGEKGIGTKIYIELPTTRILRKQEVAGL